MEREEMIQELKKIIVVASPTVMTMDMGIEYDYITSNGAGRTLGIMGEWPVYKLHGVESIKWSMIRNKVKSHSLTETDLIGTDLELLMKNLHSTYGDLFQEYFHDISEILSSIMDLPSDLPEVIYCLCDIKSWGDVPLFFIDEKELQEAFVDLYCTDIVEWEDMDDVQIWYDRFTDDLKELAIIDYTVLENMDEL